MAHPVDRFPQAVHCPAETTQDTQSSLDSTITSLAIRSLESPSAAPAPLTQRPLGLPADSTFMPPPAHPFELVPLGPRIDTEVLIKILKESMAISNQGSYLLDSKRIELPKPGDTSPRKHDSQSYIQPRYRDTEVAVIEQDTLTTAEQLHRMGAKSIGVLNLANDTNPGGKPGAQTQEENLTRRTNAQIYLDLAKAKDLYPISTRTNNGALSTPGITAFRDSNYNLLNEPFTIHLISTAAHSFKHNGGDANDKEYYNDKLKSRLASALYAAYLNGDDTVVLGAIGCGAYQNNPEYVSEVFVDLLKNEFKGCFAKVYFAVTPGVNFQVFQAAVATKGGGVIRCAKTETAQK